MLFPDVLTRVAGVFEDTVEAWEEEVQNDDETPPWALLDDERERARSYETSLSFLYGVLDNTMLIMKDRSRDMLVSVREIIAPFAGAWFSANDTPEDREIAGNLNTQLKELLEYLDKLRKHCGKLSNGISKLEKSWVDERDGEGKFKYERHRSQEDEMADLQTLVDVLDESARMYTKG